MTDVLFLLFAAVAGFALGVAFFGGLWWTVSRVMRGLGAWWLPVSSLVRTVGLLAGFWLVAQGSLVRLAACVAGWLIARWWTVRRLGPPRADAGKGGRSCT